jgi:trehalose 6-phosphate synthase/phosphatase
MATLKPLWLSLGDLTERLGKAQVLRLACDYDGTLTPIVETPEQAHLPMRSRRALESLAARDDVRVAILSGRRVDELKRQIPVSGLFLAGSSGLETMSEDGERHVHLKPEQAIPTELRSALETWCQRFPGSWVEDKQVSFALHYVRSRRIFSRRLAPVFAVALARSRTKRSSCTGSVCSK